MKKTGNENSFDAERRLAHTIKVFTVDRQKHENSFDAERRLALETNILQHVVPPYENSFDAERRLAHLRPSISPALRSGMKIPSMPKGV